VTLFTRSASGLDNVHSIVKIVEVDYTSQENLKDALSGQDAVVSTVPTAAIGNQIVFIDAAIAAGVKYFIPSDYSNMSTDVNARELPPFAGAKTVQDYLKAKSEEGKIAYSIMASGGFLDYLFVTSMFIDWNDRACKLYNNGATAISASSYAAIGKAVAAVLQAPQRWKNKAVYFHDAVVTQKEILETVQKSTPAVEWKVVPVDTANVEKLGYEKLQKGDPSGDMLILLAAVASGKYRSSFDQVDNEELGIKMMNHQDLLDRIAEKARSVTA
jgi:hypothetical protein